MNPKTFKEIDEIRKSLVPTKRQREARRKRYVRQQKEWGFCDAELWNFYMRIVGFILPRLDRFRKMSRMGYPATLSEKRWDKILDQMILAFKTLKKGVFTERESKTVQRGLDLFAKHFRDLWD